MRIFRENIHFQKANEMRKQYRFKYNLLRERCDAIRQDNEQLVSRIWEVGFWFFLILLFMFRFLMTNLVFIPIKYFTNLLQGTAAM